MVAVVVFGVIGVVTSSLHFILFLRGLVAVVTLVGVAAAAASAEVVVDVGFVVAVGVVYGVCVDVVEVDVVSLLVVVVDVVVRSNGAVVVGCLGCCWWVL